MKELPKKIIRWLATTRLLAYPKKIQKRIVFYVISAINGKMVFYNDTEKLRVLQLVKNIRDGQELLLSDLEACQIFMAVKRTAKVDGDIAEVGVYKGGSAKIICESKENKALHLFDTFEGLPELSAKDDRLYFHKKQFLSSLEKVKTYLKVYPNVYFYKGFFPDTAQAVKDKKFSFVNLDVDLYESTLSSLVFFYPRLNKGGVIMSHDYLNVPGVRKAFDEFFKEKPEPIIELFCSQCLVVKC